MDSLNDKLRDIEQNFLKKKPMKNAIVNTTLNTFLKLISFRGIALELYGKKGTGKTTTMYKLIAQLQSQGYLCMLINADFSYDGKFAEECKIDNSKLILINTNDINEILKIISGSKNCYIFIDSMAALDLEKISIDNLISIIRHNHLGLIYTNQIRNKKRGLSSYGRKLLKLYTDKRILVTKGELERIK